MLALLNILCKYASICSIWSAVQLSLQIFVTKLTPEFLVAASKRYKWRVSWKCRQVNR